MDRRLRMLPRLQEFVRYMLAAGVALAADLAGLWFLVAIGGWHYVVAATTSFLFGAVVAYTLCTRFVFSYRRLDNAPLEFASFTGIGVFGLVASACIIFACVEWLHLHYLAGKLAAAAVTFLMNFLARRLLLFTP